MTWIKQNSEALIIIGLILWILYLINTPDKHSHTSQNEGKIERLQHSIDSLNLKKDSVSVIENNLTKRITIINNYYDSTKRIIYTLPDSDQVKLFWANVRGFDSVYFSTSSKSD